MLIRSLDPTSDRALVDAFFYAVADYVRLERDEDPSPLVTHEFFTDAPPGCDPAQSVRLGMVAEGQLIAVAEMAIGYPTATDAYIGFLAVSAAARSNGAGQKLLQHLELIARDRSARQIYLAVLDANPRGRAFWVREGFRCAVADLKVKLGQKTQIAHRLVKSL